MYDKVCGSSSQTLDHGGALLTRDCGRRVFHSAHEPLTIIISQAEKKNPQDYVYPSNLSAALYELGDYTGCAKAVARSWKFLKEVPDAKPELIARLSTRLAKALCHGACTGTLSHDVVNALREDVSQIRTTAANSATVNEELIRVWKEWDTCEAEMNDYVAKRDECLARFSRLPIFCKPL